MNTQQIRQYVSSLSDDNKDELLDKIIVHNGISMLLHRRVNTGLLNFTVALLRGQNPDNPMTYRRKQYPRNSGVRIIKEARNDAT